MEKNSIKESFFKTLMSLRIKIVDRYIIRKFLGTFFFALILILVIAVVFDFAEKIDNFMEREAPWRAVVFDYYLNFIPYFGTLFAPLFVFIAVIFFTSRMAVNTEIIAILNSGMSFRRMMWPYFLSAFIIAVMIFYLTNFVIPQANLTRMDFEDKYYRPQGRRLHVENIHRQVSKNIYVYLESYNPTYFRGNRFTVEQFDEEGRLVSKLWAPTVLWDTAASRWKALNYILREVKENEEIITKGSSIDTTLTITPDDFSRDPTYVGTMTYGELHDYISLLKMQGSDELKIFQIEQHKRFAAPFAVFILTLIGVTLSSKKIRGGIGMNIGIGLALSFSYILFQQFASQFSIKGNLSPMLAMWIPNLIYILIAGFLYKMAPK
ncbi:MAG TPA: LptF/LptG family permease [Bacteroidales bacterium]|nr:LptF/LptG family permease [Bacteroidales bacterium]HPF03315.1 LptF/LptG family permease [Bacteroidales bacterium]HPJ59796.1 LptF/LptG family permease [Bacteroidales bacterium]HPR13024.1 LptF/LptG family permease [Bacteroidales bacterium]HRW85883.1 LptF/LptG family permease [Bacteroidales bacterium]